MYLFFVLSSGLHSELAVIDLFHKILNYTSFHVSSSKILCIIKHPIPRPIMLVFSVFRSFGKYYVTITTKFSLKVKKITRSVKRDLG